MTNLPIRIQKENEKDLDNEYRNYILSKANHNIKKRMGYNNRTDIHRFKAAMMIIYVICIIIAFKLGIYIGMTLK